MNLAEICLSPKGLYHVSQLILRFCCSGGWELNPEFCDSMEVLGTELPQEELLTTKLSFSALKFGLVKKSVIKKGIGTENHTKISLSASCRGDL